MRASLVALALTSTGLVASPAFALSLDALTDADTDVLPDGGEAGGDVASSETGDAADGGDAASDAPRPDAGSDGVTPTPDAAPGTDGRTDAPRSSVPDDDGCGCRVGGGKPGSAGVLTVLGALAGVGFTVRRRRRR